jgi:hypothetical protein
MAAGARLKVPYVIGGVGRGGAETLMYRLVTRASEVEHEVICLGGRGWWPYASPFQAGKPMTLTRSCHATSIWLASSTNTPPAAQRGERGK